jgi:hypothetical protein
MLAMGQSVHFGRRGGPGGYVVRDPNGQAIAYLYSRENEAEARRIAVNIARLPELLWKAERD